MKNWKICEKPLYSLSVCLTKNIQEYTSGNETYDRSQLSNVCFLTVLESWSYKDERHRCCCWTAKGLDERSGYRKEKRYSTALKEKLVQIMKQGAQKTA